MANQKISKRKRNGGQTGSILPKGRKTARMGALPKEDGQNDYPNGSMERRKPAS